MKITSTLLFLAFSLLSFAQPAFTEKTVRDMNQRLVADHLKFLLEEMAPEFTLGGAEGHLITRDQFQKWYEMKTWKFGEWTTTELKVQQMGNKAIATGVQFHTIVELSDNKTQSRNERFTYLYEYKSGKWLWVYGQHTPIVAQQTPAEEESVKKVILDESEYFSAGNLDAFMNCYAQVPYLLWTVTNGMEPGDVLTFRGYDALKSFAQGLPWFKNYKPENSQKSKPNNGLTKDNWNFQFRGNIALVTYDEHWKNEEKKTNVDLTVTKTLERINGKWKLIITTALADFKDATPPIRTKY